MLSSLSGCPEAAINNIYNAVKCGDAHGALGAVVCNWLGKGHLTHQSFAWPGFLVLAGLSWNSDCHQVSSEVVHVHNVRPQCECVTG